MHSLEYNPLLEIGCFFDGVTLAIAKDDRITMHTNIWCYKNWLEKIAAPGVTPLIGVAATFGTLGATLFYDGENYYLYSESNNIRKVMLSEKDQKRFKEISYQDPLFRELVDNGYFSL